MKWVWRKWCCNWARANLLSDEVYAELSHYTIETESLTMKRIRCILQ